MVDSHFYPRLLSQPKQSFFLFGPRGTGKSTWVRRSFRDIVAFDLLDEGLYQDLLADVSLFARRLQTVSEGSWVWIDEVQRLPNLLNEVHRFIELRKLKFILSGSSARKLRGLGVNLLAGRAIERLVFPFVPEELGKDFQFSEALRFGTLPVVWAAEDKRATLQAYVQTYLRQEIQAEALVRNLSGFARFLPIAALFHGQIVNVSNIAREAQVSRTTVDGYLDILEQTLLAFRLPAFEAKLRVRERKHPKLYWLDPGLVRATKRQLGPLAQEERGPLFEGWIAMLLRAYCSYRNLFEDMYYWAPRETTNMEVDFLLRNGDEFVAIEAKAKSRVAKSDLTGLRAICELKNLRKRIVVCLAAEPLRTADGIDIWPVARFADALAGGGLFSAKA